MCILVPRGRAPFGQHQESRPLGRSNNGTPRFTDFPSLCACLESSLTNLIGSGLNLLCLQSHSKPECRWTGPEVAILGADQKERGLWGRECSMWRFQLSLSSIVTPSDFVIATCFTRVPFIKIDGEAGMVFSFWPFQILLISINSMFWSY